MAERLREEQLKAIQASKGRIKQWECFKSDYEAVQERLGTLSKHLTHKIMVPIGKVAFMPGQLYRTNEVLVLLGDNWFSERTAYQANQIVERRLKVVREELEREKKALQDISDQHSITSKIQNLEKDVVEIKEEYDPVKELEWKKKRQSQRTEKSSYDKKKGKTKEENTDAHQLWARLNELEKEEEEQERLEEEEKKAKKRMSFRERIIGASKKEERNEEEYIDNRETDEMEKVKEDEFTPAVINFKHSKHQTSAADSEFVPESHVLDPPSLKPNPQTSDSDTPKYLTPADIFKRNPNNPETHDGKDEVLEQDMKKSVHFKSADEKAGSSPERVKPVNVPSRPAFSGLVVERKATGSLKPQVGERERSGNGRKKQSRFKASMATGKDK